ncbi:hypothetical protein DP116_07055 [Brasilonema bromeliae SPC951]|uniref:Uncharacterized protein n=1 Tax=Brasilonema bromeliae SPC951 TaxID=385972 RepID=A0ABX1P6G5_9CYAN|nr:hypothetical protein [Brasilonema bromeliae SPC951]
MNKLSLTSLENNSKLHELPFMGFADTFSNQQSMRPFVIAVVAHKNSSKALPDDSSILSKINPTSQAWFQASCVLWNKLLANAGNSNNCLITSSA